MAAVLAVKLVVQTVAKMVDLKAVRMAEMLGRCSAGQLVCELVEWKVEMKVRQRVESLVED